jgi:hypothetical protein
MRIIETFCAASSHRTTPRRVRQRSGSTPHKVGTDARYPQ